MKCKITITKIEEKIITESVYITDEELARRGEDTDGNYRDVERARDVSEVIYEQTREEGAFNLMDVINAFNGNEKEAKVKE